MITDAIEIRAVDEPTYFKTASIAQEARQELCFTLTDIRGVAQELGQLETVQNDACDPCENTNGKTFADGVEPADGQPDTRVIMRASPGYGQPLIFEVEGQIVDFDNAKVLFHLDENHTQWIGMFIAEIMLYRGDVLLRRWPLYLAIEPSLATTNSRNSRRRRGGLSLPEIRMSLRDINKDYSEVLEEVEYKDAEIMFAIQQPVDYWNDQLPYEPRLVYDYQNFPFRHEWLRATCGFLLEMAAHWYRRNDIPLSAGGMTVQDRAKHLTYEPKSAELLNHYRQWVAQRKVADSMRYAWGSVGSNWPRGRR